MNAINQPINAIKSPCPIKSPCSYKICVILKGRPAGQQKMLASEIVSLWSDLPALRWWAWTLLLDRSNPNHGSVQMQIKDAHRMFSDSTVSISWGVRSWVWWWQAGGVYSHYAHTFLLFLNYISVRFLCSCPNTVPSCYLVRILISASLSSVVYICFENVL